MAKISGPPRQPFVYFLYDLEYDLIKIGTSDDMPARFGTLVARLRRPLDFLGCVPGDVTVEQALHRQFARYLFSGEWFSVNEPLLAYIETNSTHDTPPDQGAARKQWRKDRDSHRRRTSLIIDRSNPENVALLDALADMLGIVREQFNYVDINAAWWDSVETARRIRQEDAE